MFYVKYFSHLNKYFSLSPNQSTVSIEILLRAVKVLTAGLGHDGEVGDGAAPLQHGAWSWQQDVSRYDWQRV